MQTNMARGVLTKKLQWALEGKMGPQRRFMLESRLRMLETFESETARPDESRPYRYSLRLV